MEIQDFIQQVPAGMFITVCGSGLLLLVVWGFILYRRAHRKTRRQILPSTPEVESAIAQPISDISAASETAPASNTPARPGGIMQSIKHFFFYTEEEKAARQAAPPAGAATSPAQSGVATPPAPSDAVEVLHLYRDVVDGTLIVQIGDQSYRTMGDIRAGGQERRFMAVLRELARMAKETAADVSGPEEVITETPAQPQPPATPPAAPAPPAAPIPPAASTPPAAPAAPLSAYADTSPEVEPIGSFFDNVRRAVRTGGKPTPQPMVTETTTIADQIDEILQARLYHSEEFRNRRMHLRPALSGGVRIEIDGSFYEAVSDIPDDEVRAFVQGAITEWEARS